MVETLERPLAKQETQTRVRESRVGYLLIRVST